MPKRIISVHLNLTDGSLHLQNTVEVKGADELLRTATATIYGIWTFVKDGGQLTAFGKY